MVNAHVRSFGNKKGSETKKAGTKAGFKTVTAQVVGRGIFVMLLFDCLILRSYKWHVDLGPGFTGF
jgi:hypothetical protein